MTVEQQRKAISLIMTLRQDAKLALSGYWDRSDKGFQSQIDMINKFLKSLDEKPEKGKLKQASLDL